MTHPVARVLVVDDHRKIREPLAAYLRRHDFDVRTAEDAASMWRLLEETPFELVVLDAMLPDGDGFQLCQRLTQDDRAAVILLTARGSADERIQGLDLGADDYVVKPFEPGELVARIRSVLRRRQRPSHTLPLAYRFAGLCFKPSSGVLVCQDGHALQLSTAEGRLLEVFLRYPNQVLGRDRLLDLCARPDSEPFQRSIDRQVSRLRRKLEACLPGASLLHTVWGNGYRLSADVDRERE